MAGGVRLAYYQKKDWDRFLEVIDDRDRMPDTWEEWHKEYLKVKSTLLAQGIVVIDFVVDIDELIIHCAMKGIKNDGKARSKFVLDRK